MNDKNDSDEIINVSNNEVNLICNYCDGKLKNSNFSECKHCNSHFHFRCFKNVSNNGKFCKLCISKELPFHDINVDFDLDDNENSNITYPSEMPDFELELFKKKGLHFIHLNARSVSNKMFEIRLIPKKCNNPAVIVITESWCDDSHTNESISIEGYIMIRRDSETHVGAFLCTLGIIYHLIIE